MTDVQYSELLAKVKETFFGFSEDLTNNDKKLVDLIATIVVFTLQEQEKMSQQNK